MNKVIWKHKLEITDKQKIKVPVNSELLSVVNQNNNLCLYSIGYENDQLIDEYIEVFVTGDPIAIDMGVNRKFIGTVVIGQFVWHVFHRLD